jgi:hypothetical protein
MPREKLTGQVISNILILLFYLKKLEPYSDCFFRRIVYSGHAPSGFLIDEIYLTY